MIREHRIHTPKDIASDKASDKLSAAMKQDPAEVKAKHIKWKKLFAAGWTPDLIAQKFGVFPSTVRRVTGSRFPKGGRPTESKLLLAQQIRIGRKVYASKNEARRQLKIGLPRLEEMLRLGRARYVR